MRCTAVQTCRRLVGQHHAIPHGNVANIVGASEVAVHAIERRRLRRTDMGADVLDLIPIQRAHATVRIDRRFEPRRPTGRRHGRGEMLEPVLDPFHRPPAHLRRNAHQHHVRKDALLHAEAPAGIWRRT
jgi:hypothetical protein